MHPDLMIKGETPYLVFFTESGLKQFFQGGKLVNATSHEDAASKVTDELPTNRDYNQARILTIDLLGDSDKISIYASCQVHLVRSERPYQFTHRTVTDAN